MDKSVDKYRYLLTLFVYAMYNQTLRINTVFRLIYIYRVSIDYLTGSRPVEDDDSVFVDPRHQGVADYRFLNDALGLAISGDYIREDDNLLNPGNELEELINKQRIESEQLEEDIQRISYFSDVILTYGEDVILAIFYKEPNVDNAFNRNRSVINLGSNELVKQLEEFERIASEKTPDRLEKYDVFISWLNFVLDEYIKEKSE